MGKVFIILGPTGTGKTKHSIEMAEKLNGEILNIDAAQFYKNFKIGTGVIKEDEMMGIKHHFFSCFNIEFDFSVFSYKEILENKIKEILDNGKTPILVGGSHFYINSLFFKEEKEDFNKLSVDFDFEISEIEKKENDEIYKILQEKDPKRASELNKNDKFRVINSLKRIKELGFFPKIIFSPNFDFEIIESVKLDSENYKKALEKRIDIFFKEGWIEEIKNLSSSEIKFLKKRKFIGYDLLIEEIELKNIEKFYYDEIYKKKIKEMILNKTLYYAKKQSQFIERLRRILTFNKVIWRKVGE